MRFIYFSLAFNPNVNATQMQPAIDSTQITLRYFYSNLINLGSYLQIMKIFSRNLIAISVQYGLEVLPTRISLRFLTKRNML